MKLESADYYLQLGKRIHWTSIKDINLTYLLTHFLFCVLYFFANFCIQSSQKQREIQDTSRSFKTFLLNVTDFNTNRNNNKKINPDI